MRWIRQDGRCPFWRTGRFFRARGGSDARQNERSALRAETDQLRASWMTSPRAFRACFGSLVERCSDQVLSRRGERGWWRPRARPSANGRAAARAAVGDLAPCPASSSTPHLARRAPTSSCALAGRNRRRSRRADERRPPLGWTPRGRCRRLKQASGGTTRHGPERSQRRSRDADRSTRSAKWSRSTPKWSPCFCAGFTSRLAMPFLRKRFATVRGPIGLPLYDASVAS